MIGAVHAGDMTELNMEEVASWKGLYAQPILHGRAQSIAVEARNPQLIIAEEVQLRPRICANVIKRNGIECNLVLPPVLGVSRQVNALASLPICDFKRAVGEVRLGAGTKRFTSGFIKGLADRIKD